MKSIILEERGEGDELNFIFDGVIGKKTVTEKKLSKNNFHRKLIVHLFFSRRRAITLLPSSPRLHEYFKNIVGIAIKEYGMVS